MGLFDFKSKAMPLPPNRFLQFFYIIKENFLLLFYTSITYFFFNIPLIYILLSTYLKYRDALNNKISNTKIFEILLTGAFLLIPASIILSIATIGMHNVIKKLSYNEPTQYKDFFIGIKGNYIKNILLFIVDALLSAVLVINYGIYLFITINPMFKLISLIISIILFTLIKLIKPFYMLQDAVFENSKFLMFKNSLTFAFSHLLKNICIYVLSNILTITIFLLPDEMRTINIVLLIIIGGATTLLIQHLNSLHILEKHIDTKTYKTIFHKGLIDYYEKDDENVELS